MPKIPESVNKRVTDATSRFRGRATVTAKKLRQIDPKVAKTSAGQGAGGAKDVVRLAVAYAKQETIDPVRALGRYLLWGTLGALVMCFGFVLLVLGALRFVQTHHKFGRTTVFVPYVLTAAGAVIALVLLGLGYRRSVRHIGQPRTGDN